MNRETIEGNWKQLSGKITEKWGKITGDDLAVAKGDMKIVAGKLQEHYGLAKEDAEKQLHDFISKNFPHRPKQGV